MLCKWWVLETKMWPEISAVKEPEIKGMYLVAMSLLFFRGGEMAPLCSHFISEHKDNRVDAMLISGLKFMLIESRPEHCCFVAYSSVKECIKLLAMSPWLFSSFPSVSKESGCSFLLFKSFRSLLGS